MKKITFLIVAFFLSLSLSAQDKKYHGDGPDDVLQYVPFGSLFVLKAIGVDSESSWKRMAVNAAASYVFTAGTAWVLKHSIHERRPDGTDNRSFPSGHCAIAFAGAHALNKEYGHVSPWISVAGYGVATFTAIDRVCRNRHHWYDAVAGAAIGIASTELGYWIGDKITGEHGRYSFAIAPQGISVKIALAP